MKTNTKEKIANILEACITRALTRVKTNQSNRPFHEALLTKELVLASSFERSFSTSFGQGPVEEISELIAKDNGYETKRQKETMVNVYKGAIDEIERISSSLRAGDKKPNWDKELQKVIAYNKGDIEVRRVITDLWLRKDGIESYISIKTVKPNLDQTEIAKKDMFLLKAHNPDFKTYFGLYYNPGGEKQVSYNWGIPFKVFNMHQDNVVLIGADYWNKLGGSGTYTELLGIFQSVGIKTRAEIGNL